MKKNYFCLILLLLSSCETRDCDPIQYISNISRIKIDTRTDPYSLSMQIYNSNLYWLNSTTNSISVLNIKNKNLEKIITIDEEGPNGINRPLGIFVKSIDSIYIPSIDYNINLISSKGEKINQIEYSNLSPLSTLAGSLTRYSRFFMKVGDKLYFQTETLSILEKSEQNTDNLRKYPPLLALNTKEGLLGEIQFRIPNSILNLQNSISFLQTLSKKGILLLHERSNLLFELDPLTLNNREIILKSDLLGNFNNEYFLSDRNSNSIQNNMRLLYKSSQNLGIVHDPFKDLIYRFGWPGETISEIQDPMEYSFSTPYFVISVYDDSNYSLLAEFKLPINTYLAHHFFVDEKGINLFPMHPNNPEFSEDEMVIHTFDFSDLRNKKPL
jgi:hypothetical protein